MKTKQAFNPYLPLDEYIPDGEAHVFGDRLYLFGSHDEEGGSEYCILDYACYSAPVTDLSDWHYEGVSLRAEQDPDYEPDSRMYAPDVVCGNDGRYYMYYQLQTHRGHNQPISVAVCDTPAGPYSFYGHLRNPDGTPFTKYLTHDPGLLNDEGVIRLYYGYSLASGAAKAHYGDDYEPPASSVPPGFEDMDPELAMATMVAGMFHKSVDETLAVPGLMGANEVVLDDDMLTVIDGPHRIVPGEFDAEGTSFDGHAFYEASSVRKIGDTYYFVYSSQKSNELCYATSKKPDRDFVYGGILQSNGDVGLGGRRDEDRLNMTANNHGGLECVNGQLYVFYHRHTHNGTYSRQACAEPVTMMPDGSLLQAECTSSGLNGGPLEGSGTYSAVICCNLTNGHMPHATNRMVNADIPFVTHDQGDRFITNIKDGTLIGYKYFDFAGPVTLGLRLRGTGTGTGAFEILAVPAEGEGGSVADATSCAATIEVAPAETRTDASATMNIQGMHALYLTYRGEGSVDLLSIDFGA